MGGVWSYFQGYFLRKDRRILVLGLDGAGKTALLYRLQMGEVVTTIPTIGFNVEHVEKMGLKLQVWDLGGQTSIRPYWRCYYANTDAIIFVVDSADVDRFVTAKEELMAMLKEEELKGVTLLILANKQDLPDAASDAKIIEALETHTIRERTYKIHPVSVLEGKGVNDAIEWLASELKKKN